MLNDENVRRLISDYENINNVNTSKPNNTNTHKLNNEIILKGIEVVAQKDLQDYLVDGAEAINSMVKIIGEEKAATAILITQFATQGIVKTSVSMLMEEGKDTLFGGVKDKISNYISKDLFEVNDKGWQDKQKEAIYSLSDVSADFSIDLAISGPFALMKGAKNLGKANKKFDESLKENNVNSDTIVNSNAELKSNEHNLNNKNSSDGVVTGNGDKVATGTTGDIVKNKITSKETILEIFNTVGIKSIGKGSKGVRLVKDNNELNLVWDKLTKDAKDIKPVLANDKTIIIRKELDDGTIIKYRPTSKSGGATIEIEPVNGGVRKIHYKE